MGLTDLNFSSLPGAGAIGNLAASDPVGASNYLDSGAGFELNLSNFSSVLDGEDWYKIFPYQFIILDYGDTPPAPEPFDESQFIQKNASIGPDVGVNITKAKQAGINDDPSLSVNQDNTEKLNQARAAYAARLAQKQALADQDARKVVYTLPIPPDGLGVQPMFASEVRASLGGIVEETSPTVFWMITLTGTTGVAIGRSDSDTPANVFRDVLSTTGLLSGLGSSLNKLASTVTNVVDSAADLAANPSVSGAADLAAAALLPKLPYAHSAVSDGTESSNGYLEMHLLHRFLNAYGELKAKRANGAKLIFINYKDGQQWQVIVKSFKISKSVNEPMLYRYQIVLQGWDLQDPNENQATPIDRYKTDLKSVNTTTLTGLVSSANSFVSNTIGNPNNIIPIVI